MHVKVIILLVTLVAFCNGHREFETKVKNADTFAALLTIARNESESADSFISQQAEDYKNAVISNNETYNALVEQFAESEKTRKLQCILRKFDYSRVRKSTGRLIKGYAKENIPEYLNKKYSKERAKLEKNIIDIQLMQDRAEPSDDDNQDGGNEENQENEGDGENTENEGDGENTENEGDGENTENEGDGENQENEGDGENTENEEEEPPVTENPVRPPTAREIAAMKSQARKMIIKAHKRFYHAIERHMKDKINNQDATLTRRRGGMTKRGRRLMKCAV
ncbi:protein PFC0760c-like [Atheta coriaria]|uniref:protein PFC0760c-like n=1 Tax=Dalotia coriaria TaxID=877792 RepID=UPI0031F3A13D